MLGCVILKAKEDNYIKTRDGGFIFRKDELYAGYLQEYNYVKIYDERDNAISYEFYCSCFRTEPHYSSKFELVKQMSVSNKKEFRKLREQLRLQNYKGECKMMNGLEEVKRGFKDFLDVVDMGDSIYDLKMEFLCDILNITTYDRNLSNDIGSSVLEVLDVINNGKNFEYIQDEDNYKKFILVCNVLDHAKWIEWGYSIRGCWLNEELNVNELYNMPEKVIFKDKQDINNLINYLKDDSQI